jgi:hypothetical protein
MGQDLHLEETRHSALRGVQIGLGCGFIFGVAATIGAVLVGYGPLLPLQLGASVILGGDALLNTSTSVVALGLLVHFAVSLYYGMMFGLMHERFIHVHWMKNGYRMVLGVLFGLLVWAINLQVIARILYPWFLDFTQPILAAIHALFFGLPLAMMYVARERRAAPRREPQHA